MEKPDLSASHHYLGRFLKMRRDQWDIKQREVIAHLPGWTQANYSRLESGVIAPSFDQLFPIYQALGLAGVPWTIADRRQFLELARKRIEAKKTRWERRPDTDWAELRYQLASTDQLPEEPVITAQQERSPRPLLRETRHLVGREEWLSMVIEHVQGRTARKLIILQGPMGVGKSSELHRLATYFIETTQPAYTVIWLPLPTERNDGAEASLEMFLGTTLTDLGAPSSTPVLASLDARMTSVLVHLERSSQRVILLVDNAEGVLTNEGVLAPCWEQFLAQFLSFQHQATIILATKEWPGWPGRERSLIAEIIVPPLSIEASILLLQHLGLERVPVHHLQTVSERVGGIPLCLEWVAALAQDPILLDEWQGFDLDEEGRSSSQDVTRHLLRLLDEPSLLRGHFANKLQPLLERIIEQRLSSEAGTLLQQLAVANVPLGIPALKVLCQRPHVMKELRDASLLVAYPHRVQLLPMVASAVYQQLTLVQVKEKEEQLTQALTYWLDEGIISIREGGNIITELAVLYLKHHRLLDTAQLLIYYGWLSYNLGYGPRLARLAADVMQAFDWQSSLEEQCGGMLVHHLLTPFLGETDDEKRVADFQQILNEVLVGHVALRPATEMHLIRHLMLYHMMSLRFEEAQSVLEACYSRFEPYRHAEVDVHASLLAQRAWLLTRWSEYLEEQDATETVHAMRVQAITLYRQCCTLLSISNELSSLKGHLLKKRLSAYFNSLGYLLNRSGQSAEALQVLEQSISLGEQGYCNFGALAAAYGDTSQALMELGRFREALLFDEKALAEAQRCANTGDAFSQDDVWIYRVNRGRLYLRLGRVDEAEQLLREAESHIYDTRRVYRMFTKEALNEIEEWRRQATSPQHQLDWRWQKRYRELGAYDAFWWWAAAGPFTEEEQQQWNHLSAQALDEARKGQLGAIIAQSRQREFVAAIAEQREPCLHYPALDSEAVHGRIAAFVQLDAEIRQAEPNVIVRSLYHGAIESEVDFLRMIEATGERNTERFWEHSQCYFGETTSAEMTYALARLRRVLQQGFERPETADIGQRLIHFLQERLHLSLDLSVGKEDPPVVREYNPSEVSQTVSPQAAKRFFEAILHDGGYDGWQVMIDPNAGGARVESGLRQLFIRDAPDTVAHIRHLVAHELAGHVARSMAGERSPIGLLGIGTQGYAPTEEGLALYHERQATALHGLPFSDSALWLGTLATGLASGVVTPPLTFLSLYGFFEILFLLHRRIWKPGEEMQVAQERARELALSRCLTTFRGVPDLEQAGVCYLQDNVYLRGLFLVERIVAEDEKALDRLAIGKVAYELLPVLQELELIPPPQPLRQLAYDSGLDAYVQSFEESGESTKKPA
jgi:tetratricopeptide (TPR) repeat protein/transcriptional regulator with XRE-family HTH domain